jgi:uncharacterized membrane protein YfcA
MNALKVLLATIINGVAAVLFFFSRQVDWRYVLPMAIASTIGGFLGMFVARRIKQNQLRAVILLIGIVLTFYYFVKNYRAVV